MNREIKFRAWDSKNNKWLHGYAEGKQGCSVYGETMIIGGWLSEISISNLNDVIVSEYTGLKDKNGIEIYEGDIIKCSLATEPEDLGFICKWQNYKWVFCNVRFKDDESYNLTDFDYIGRKTEIIGNIYENADILTTEA